METAEKFFEAMSFCDLSISITYQIHIIFSWGWSIKSISGTCEVKNGKENIRFNTDSFSSAFFLLFFSTFLLLILFRLTEAPLQKRPAWQRNLSMLMTWHRNTIKSTLITYDFVSFSIWIKPIVDKSLM